MFQEYIENYNESIEGLREFVELINPFLLEYSKKVTEEHMDALKPLSLAQLHFFEKDEEKKKKYSEELSKIYDGEIEVEVHDETDNVTQKIPKVTLKVKGDASKFDEAFQKISKSVTQKELLYKNSLISLLSSVEWFFSQILHFHYDEYPDSAGIKKKTLTLEELKSFNSLKDAENYLIDDKIESILRGSLTDWFEILKSELKLNLSYLQTFEDELIEFYQRRNILVHNGGIINSIYLSKVSDKYKNDISIGDRVSVTKEYLERAISLLHALFILIACELWKKVEPCEELRGTITMDLGYDYLKKEMWAIAEVANTFLCNDKKMPIASRTAAQINIWLSKKRNGKFEEVKKEVEEADFSDKSKVFQVALFALREEIKPFFSLLPHVLKTEELLPSELIEFPVFSNMREKEEFHTFIQENGIMKLHIGNNSY